MTLGLAIEFRPGRGPFYVDMILPELFLERMRGLLGEEFEAFLASYERPEPVGLRANPLKIEPGELRDRLPWRLDPIPWTETGFLVGEKLANHAPSPGKHPYHAAGVYYLQEPSAMAAAEALALAAPLKAGERILDLCAAPGGKSTHLAGMMQGSGLLIANETHPQRVWELAGNIERWGARNAIILNETTMRLAEKLTGFFDRVLVDAPCSGEGMFRKSEPARRDWSPDRVYACAMRQSSILEDGLRMLRPGGMLVYSTCTFNPDENEAVVARLLRQHPECQIVSLRGLPDSTPGRPDWSEGAAEVEGAARLWPHRSVGEGHFVAVIQKDLKEEVYRTKMRRVRPIPKSEGEELFHRFQKEHLVNELWEDDRREIRMVGTHLYAIPHGAPDLNGLKVVHPGWWLGNLQHGERSGARFEPGHALALGLAASQVRRGENLAWDAPENLAYLRGEPLAIAGEDGWTLVSVDGFALSWGKRSQGVLKNYYPKGLRWV